MSLIDRIKYEQRTLLSFCHGLGDTILFLPIYHEIQKQTNKRIELGVHSKRQFHLIYPDVVLVDKIGSDIKSKYSFFYSVRYGEPNGILSKPYLCAKNEFGLDDFIWEPYRFKNDYDNSNSKRIGVCFFGITGSNKESKFCPTKTAERIWGEIQSAGYEPFELYQGVNFIKDYYIDGKVPDAFNLTNESNSLRFQEPNLLLLFNEIKKCKKVICVDNGVLYLSLSLLGERGIIGLENQKQIQNYLPRSINIVNVKNYREGSIYNLLTTNQRRLN